MSETIQRILSFHLRDLTTSSWEGDYEDIGKQHQMMFKDILEDCKFRIPSKRTLGNCLLGAYPSAEKVLRDKTRDCMLNVLRDIQVRLKSSTTGKKLPGHLRGLLDGYRNRNKTRGKCLLEEESQQSNGMSSSSSGTTARTVTSKTHDSHEDGYRTPLNNIQKQLLRKYGLGTPPSPDHQIALPTVDDSPSAICSQVTSAVEVNSSCPEDEDGKKQSQDDDKYPNINQNDAGDETSHCLAGEPQNKAQLLESWWDQENCTLRLLLAVEGKLIEEVATLKNGSSGFAVASCPKFGVNEFETEVANIRLQPETKSVVMATKKADAKHMPLKRPGAKVVQQVPKTSHIEQEDSNKKRKTLSSRCQDDVYDVNGEQDAKIVWKLKLTFAKAQSYVCAELDGKMHLLVAFGKNYDHKTLLQQLVNRLGVIMTGPYSCTVEAPEEFQKFKRYVLKIRDELMGEQ